MLCLWLHYAVRLNSGVRPPWRAAELSRFASTSDRSDRAVSAIAAVAMVGGAVLLLIFTDRSGSARIGTEVASLQVVWIERDEARDKEIEPRAAAGAPDQEIKPEMRTRKAQTSKARGDVEAHTASESTERDRLNLSLPTASMEFRQALLERPDKTVREPVLQVTFQDRSLGGALQRMSHRKICAELSSALESQPGSYEAIANSMARHKCKV